MMSKGRMGTIGSLVSALGLLAGLAASAHAFTQKGVGVVTALRGEVAVTHVPEVAAREARPRQEGLKFRDDIFFRDTIDTQRDSTAKLLLRGRSTFTIRELSRVELREGVVPTDPTRTRSIVSLLTGAFRAIVQRDIRPQDELEVQTPNAISAIRGTDVFVEVYPAGTTPPPLPTAAAPPEEVIQPVSFEVAQITPIPSPVRAVVSRWFVRDGEIEVEGLRARPGEGIEKVGTLPPRLFRFLPDFINTLIGRFAIAVVQGPLGAHQARIVAANQGQAASEAGGGGGAFLPGTAPSFAGLINGATALLNRDIVINESFTGFVSFGGTNFLLDPSFSPGMVTFSTADGSTNGSYSPGSGTATGTLRGTARFAGSAASGSVTFNFSCAACAVNFQSTLSGLTIQGNHLVVKGSGPASCTGGSCLSSPTSATVTFK